MRRMYSSNQIKSMINQALNNGEINNGLYLHNVAVDIQDTESTGYSFFLILLSRDPTQCESLEEVLGITIMGVGREDNNEIAVIAYGDQIYQTTTGEAYDFDYETEFGFHDEVIPL